MVFALRELTSQGAEKSHTYQKNQSSLPPPTYTQMFNLGEKIDSLFD